MAQPISIRGARVHNLRGVDCDLPRNALVVVTGPSGSGKSSLAFDTLYAEGQRRYVESLSAYARQFLQQLPKPEVDSITGLSPAIAIEPRTAVGHPRSTVGTVTEVDHHLRALFAALGRPHCPRCGRPIAAQTAEQVAERLVREASGQAVSVLAPVVRGRKGGFCTTLTELAARGYRKARVDGSLRSLDASLRLDPRRRHDVEVLVERLLLRPGSERRLAAALEKAFALADDVAQVGLEGGEAQLFSRRLACVRCGISVPEVSPRAFSFNSPYGACAACDGLGLRWAADPDKVAPDDSLSLLDGAIHPWQRHGRHLVREALEPLARRHRFSLEVPLRELTPRVRQLLLEGDGQGFPGVLAEIERRVAAAVSRAPGAGEVFSDLRGYLSEEICRACRGTRLRRESLAFEVGGRSIADYAALPVREALRAVSELLFEERERPVADRLLPEIATRLGFLESLGLGYLCLDRPMGTLSGGEAHRIRLATQLGARMQGMLYVLDEPSVGLHPRDNRRLLDALTAIRDLGNTVVVVEHDPETIRAADHVVDLGEGAGRLGGCIVYQGPPASLDGSLTGRYLRGELSIPVPGRRRSPQGELRILGAREHNLRGLDVAFPLGVLTAVTGVSGSGKSTLVDDILHRALARRFSRVGPEPGRHDALLGAEGVDRVVAVDQAPLSRTPRANPATYAGAFAFVRDLFSLVPEARARGYKPGRFSFNVRGGRCEACQGDGVRTVGMHFLPDAYVTCEACGGTRYNRETLEVLYRGHSIADVLALTVAEAQALLGAHPRLERVLMTLVEVGLGYLRLGQSATTLSGGEAQRLKLARELARRDSGRSLYLLDEPTTGLHFDDVKKLVQVLDRLVDAGNTVIVVEHNLEVIKVADHVIDLGPEAGKDGGRLVVQGTPEAVARCPRSHTGRHLRAVLDANGAGAPQPHRGHETTAPQPHSAKG